MDLLYDATVGRGSIGEVWLATDTARRQVAVKFFRGTTSDLAEAEAERHALALAKVTHPAVVRLYGLEKQVHPDDQTERLAVVMEYVPGTSLEQYKADFSPSQAAAIVESLVSGMEAIHAAGITHGDFHAGNIIITETGAKIIDILYAYSLRDVGTRMAAAHVSEDIRDLATIIRAVLEKNALSRRIRARIHSCYCTANDTAKTCRDVKNAFQAVLNVLEEAGRNATAEFVEPNSLLWYFLHDEHMGTRFAQRMEIEFQGEVIPVRVHGQVDLNSNAKYLSCYLSDHAQIEQLSAILMRDIRALLAIFDGLTAVYSHKSGTDPPRFLSDAQFTGRLFLYLESQVTPEQRERINNFGRERGLFPHVRDIAYAEMRNHLTL